MQRNSRFSGSLKNSLGSVCVRRKCRACTAVARFLAPDGVHSSVTNASSLALQQWVEWAVTDDTNSTCQSNFLKASGGVH